MFVKVIMAQCLESMGLEEKGDRQSDWLMGLFCEDKSLSGAGLLFPAMPNGLH